LSYQIPCHTGCRPLVPSVTIILQRFAAEWATRLQPEAILAACGEVGDPAWRDRVLTPVTTIQLFLSQILHGDTAFRHLPHRLGLWFTAAAYCQAGAKLPRRLFALLLEHLGSVVQRSALDEGRWHGHCIFFVDRSGARGLIPQRCKMRSRSRWGNGRGGASPWRACWDCSMPAPAYS
jgi:hypothetical protein